jgi:hemerythrin superfamily protein
MATRTRSRSTQSTTSRKQPRNSDGEFTSRSRDRDTGGRNAVSGGDRGPVIGAALAGVALGFAANYGRKFLMQGMESMAGDWDEMLGAEHDMALAIFDKMLATDESQSFKRKMLLMKLTHALDKHAHQEEMVVYPALREANETADADHLESEHGYIKTFIYELNEMGPEASNWLEKVREFRALVAEHAHMEEEEVFPRFKQAMDEDQNARITSLVNRDGFWMA